MAPTCAFAALTVAEVAQAIDGALERFAAWNLDGEIAEWHARGELAVGERLPDAGEVRTTAAELATPVPSPPPWPCDGYPHRMPGSHHHRTRALPLATPCHLWLQPAQSACSGRPALNPSPPALIDPVTRSDPPIASCPAQSERGRKLLARPLLPRWHVASSGRDARAAREAARDPCSGSHYHLRHHHSAALPHQLRPIAPPRELISRQPCRPPRRSSRLCQRLSLRRVLCLHQAVDSGGRIDLRNDSSGVRAALNGCCGERARRLLRMWGGGA